MCCVCVPKQHVAWFSLIQDYKNGILRLSHATYFFSLSIVCLRFIHVAVMWH